MNAERRFFNNRRSDPSGTNTERSSMNFVRMLYRRNNSDSHSPTQQQDVQNRVQQRDQRRDVQPRGQQQATLARRSETTPDRGAPPPVDSPRDLPVIHDRPFAEMLIEEMKSKHLDGAVEHLREELKKSSSDFGLKRLEMIRDNKPQDIEAFNKQSVRAYEKRYDTVVTRYQRLNEIGQAETWWDVKTFVKGQSHVSYHGEINLEKGEFHIKESFRNRPLNMQFYNYGRFPEGAGPFDSEAKRQDTKLLKHSTILYNQIEKTLMTAQQEGYDRRQFTLKKTVDHHIIHKETVDTMDRFIPANSKAPFEKGSLGYNALVGTGIGNGKWYLGQHHYNRDVSRVEMERTTTPEEGYIRYNVTCYFE